MSQVKVYGRRSAWAGRQREVSDLLHAAFREAWKLPEEKRFHRFLLLDAEDWVMPARGERYLVVEVLCFEGRSPDAKRALIRTLYRELSRGLGLEAADLEITIIETPQVNWGIRGVPGDELSLTYPVEL
ncbi:tautomerase family protein [Spirillospora sp. NPDC127200]